MISLVILSIFSASEYSVAQSNLTIVSEAAYNGFDITLVSFAQGRKIDMVSERITERIAERALKLAAERVENKAATKTEIKAQIKAEAMATRRVADRVKNTDKIRIKRKSAIAAHRKERKIKKKALNRMRELPELYDDNGFKAINHELLILAKKDSFLKIDEKNYPITERNYLAGLEMVLIKVSSPKNKNLSQSASEMKSLIDNADISLNHLFIPEFQDTDDGNAPYTITDISQSLNLT
ncbi:MAG: hypothetical protein L3J50_04105, partial [Emcibacter sp.]|nr:hypothetical protein [Emcibacter sp.]